MLTAAEEMRTSRKEGLPTYLHTPNTQVLAKQAIEQTVALRSVWYYRQSS